LVVCELAAYLDTFFSGIGAGNRLAKETAAVTRGSGKTDPPKVVQKSGAGFDGRGRFKRRVLHLKILFLNVN